MIRHCVPCRFRPDVAEAAKADLHRRLEALRGRHDGMGPVAFGPDALLVVDLIVPDAA